MKIFALIFIFLFGFSISYACTCRDDKSTKDYIRDSKAIFIGKVISIKEQSESKDEFGKTVIPNFSDAKVEVIKSWKGVEKSEIMFEKRIWRGKVFEKTEQTENSEGFWANFWRKIVSIFL